MTHQLVDNLLEDWDESGWIGLSHTAIAVIRLTLQHPWSIHTLNQDDKEDQSIPPRRKRLPTVKIGNDGQSEWIQMSYHITESCRRTGPDFRYTKR